ncbi:MAG TPA: hydroxymethylglutaryl-CoA lyase [Terriglobales bacterium]|jgi:hydroxymethylglutaryl-CoA lyase|nr:hydroxymethylglutaryl-CoA lyase [Terriglobales bacterium]
MAVKLIECPRDAWQGLKGQIPTDIKVAYLRALIGAGFKHIDAVSFVSPKAVPQMADSEDVLLQLDPPDDVELIGIVVNEKGAERAINSEAVRTLGFPYSVSPTFLERNQKQSLELAVDELEKIKKMCDEAALEVVAYVSMAFGNPYGDMWNIDEVTEAVGIIADMGIEMISLADTVGLATPDQIKALCEPVALRYDHVEVGVHLHSRVEQAPAKILAAYDAGIRRFDSALAGLGGCPFAQDMLVGNIPTEVVIEALAQRGEASPVAKPLSAVSKMSLDIGNKYAMEVRH